MAVDDAVRADGALSGLCLPLWVELATRRRRGGVSRSPLTLTLTLRVGSGRVGQGRAG
jgi:hypothetical protein